MPRGSKIETIRLCGIDAPEKAQPLGIEARDRLAQLLEAGELQKAGLKAFDALHIACAEVAAVDCFLTTDDRLIRRAAKTLIAVPVSNPVDWFMAVTAIDKTESPNGDDANDPR